MNDNDWTDVSWEDIGSGKNYNLISKASGKSSMDAGDKLRFRNIDKWSDIYGNATYITISFDEASARYAKVYGKLSDSITHEYAISTMPYKFIAMFDSSNALLDASGLDITSNITFANDCYNSMFANCDSLTASPLLLATTLTTNCYMSMFDSCLSLTSIPELPA